MNTVKQECNPKILTGRTYENCTFYDFGDNRSLNDVKFINCTFKNDIVNLSAFDVEFIDCDLTEVVFKEMEDFTGIKYINCKLPPFQIVPSSGSFTGWKKVRGGYVLKLLIPANAKRTSSLVGRKCRASKVKVLSAEPSTENSYTPKVKPRKFYSMYDNCFSYELGKIVEEPTYDPTIFKECSRGIHFFMTKQEAIEY
jgi:hypothetical protein